MERDEFRKKIDSLLHQWQGELDELKVKASLAKADARDEIERKMKELHHSRQELRAKLDELQDKGADAWQTMKEGIEKGAAEIGKAFDELRGKFKG